MAQRTQRGSVLRASAAALSAVLVLPPAPGAGAADFPRRDAAQELPLVLGGEPVTLVDVELAAHPDRDGLMLIGLRRFERDGAAVEAAFHAALTPTPQAHPGGGTRAVFVQGPTAEFDPLLPTQRAALGNAVVDPATGVVYSAVTILDANTAAGSFASVHASGPDASQTRRDDLPSGSSDFFYTPHLVSGPGGGAASGGVALIGLGGSFFTPGFGLDRFELAFDASPANRETLLPSLSTGNIEVGTAGAATRTRSLYVTTDGDDLVGVFVDADGAASGAVTVVDVSETPVGNFTGFSVAGGGAADPAPSPAAGGGALVVPAAGATDRREPFIIAAVADMDSGASGVSAVAVLSRVNPVTGEAGPFIRLRGGLIDRKVVLASSPDRRRHAVFAPLADGVGIARLDRTGAPRSSVQVAAFGSSAFAVTQVTGAVSRYGLIAAAGIGPGGTLEIATLARGNPDLPGNPKVLHYEDFVSPQDSPDWATEVTGDNTIEISQNPTDANDLELKLTSLDGSPVTFTSTIDTYKPSSMEATEADRGELFRGKLGGTLKFDQAFIDGEAKLVIEWILQSTIDPGMMFGAELTLTSEALRKSGTAAGQETVFFQDFEALLTEENRQAASDFLDDGIATSRFRVTLSAASDPVAIVDDLFIELDLIPEPSTLTALTVLALTPRCRRAARDSRPG